LDAPLRAQGRQLLQRAKLLVVVAEVSLNCGKRSVACGGEIPNGEPVRWTKVVSPARPSRPRPPSRSFTCG